MSTHPKLSGVLEWRLGLDRIVWRCSQSTWGDHNKWL